MVAATYQLPSRQGFVHPALRLKDRMQVGNLVFAYGDVEHYSTSASIERDWDGQLGCAAFYGIASALFLIGILIGSLDLKFLIAVVFLGAVCFMSISDALGTPVVTMHYLHITLRDGRRTTFLDADCRVIETLAGRIAAAGGRAVEE